MHADFRPVEQCIACGAKGHEPVLLAYDPHYGNPGESPVVRCSECGLHWLNPMPTEAYLAKAYPPTYYAHTQSRKSRIKTALRRLAFLNYDKTGDPHFPAPGRMLDIGCGAGDFLLEMRARGWEVEGVEPHITQAPQGLQIYTCTLHEAALPSALYDYVRLNHSFEHMADPVAVLREIRRILKP